DPYRLFITRRAEVSPLSFDNLRFKFDEERLRLAQRLTLRQVAWLPAANRFAAVIDQRLMRALALVIFGNGEIAEKLAIVTQIGVQLLCAVRQERREQDLEVVDNPQDRVNRPGGVFGIFLDRLP